MEGWMKSDERGKHVDKIWNVVVTEDGWKSKAMKVKVLLCIASFV